MKTCFVCGQDFPLEGFYAHPMMADGHLNKCKGCTRKQVRDNRAAKRDYYRDFDRSRASLPHRVEARKAYARTSAGRAKARVAGEAWAERNPEKIKAQNAVGNAVRDGKLSRQPCVVCGSTDSEGHHEDYGKLLDVVWLCPAHHAARHKELRNYPERTIQYEAAA